MRCGNAVFAFWTGSLGRGRVLIPYRRLIYLAQARQVSGTSRRDGKTRRIMTVPSRAQLDTKDKTVLPYLFFKSSVLLTALDVAWTRSKVVPGR